MTAHEAREFIQFLHGAVPWNGTWFGEYAPGEKGAYWWRKHLDEAIAALIAAPAAPQQVEPVAQIGWADEFGNLFPMGAWKPTQRTHHDSHKAAWRPVFLHPPADEVRLQGGLDNEELLEAWRTKVPGVEPTDSDLRAFALGVEFGTRGKRVYFDERNSARDAWRRRVKQCETLEAEVQRLKQERDGLKNRLESRHDGGPDGISARDETIKMQDAEVQRLRDALENVRLLAARHRKEEWAGHMLRFCADAGVTGSPLREGGK